MRKVIFVPMMHERGDTPGTVNYVLDLHPQEERDELGEKIEDHWQKLNQDRDRLVGDPDKTRVFFEATMNVSAFSDVRTRFAGKHYSDDKAKEIIERLLTNARNSEIFDTEAKRLLLYLLVRGAHIEVTEDKQAYGDRHEAIDEYTRVLQRFYEEGEDNFTPFSQEELGRLDRSFQMIDEAMGHTDKFVAGQVNTKLKDGETGILVFGTAHFRILDMLDEDIQIDYLSDDIREIVIEERRGIPISLGERLKRDFLEWQEGGAREQKG